MQNCYNTDKRVPREKQFDQDERLTNKHIQTLQFVQEVVKENKELKKKVEELELQQVNCKEIHAFAEESQEKIKRIQEQYLKRADEINAMMAEKHRVEMMHLEQEKLDQEKQMKDQVTQLKQEISGLEFNNRELSGRAEMLAETEQKVEMLTSDIDDLKKTISDLQMEIDKLHLEKSDLSDEKSSQFSQIQDLQELRSQNKTLEQELKAMTNKNTELNHKIRKLDLDLKEAALTKDHADLIENMKNKLGKLHKERAVGLEKESFYEKMISELKEQVKDLKEQLNKAEVTRERILEEYYKVHSELQHWKKSYTNESKDKTFKDFVKLKREVNALKTENLDLKREVGIPANGSTISLPMLRYEPPTRAEKPLSEKKKKQPFSITSGSK